MVLSKAKFIAWLNTKHPRTKAGVSCDADFCPLAKFLTQTTGIQYNVDGDSYVQQVRDSEGDLVDREETRQTLPQWAQEFIQAVDDNDYRSVSVGRALTIVENSNIGRGRVNQF
jgi:hypothetical protein